MYSTRKMLLIAGIALIVGGGGGTIVGFELSSRFWYRMSRPTLAAAGVQAYGLLTLLDRKEESRVRELLELEVDSTLTVLRAQKESGSWTPGDPLALTYERLESYRREHPLKPRWPRRTLPQRRPHASRRSRRQRRARPTGRRPAL